MESKKLLTEKQITELPLHAKIVAQGAAIDWLVPNLRMLLDSLPAETRSRLRAEMKMKIAEARDAYVFQTNPSYPPEQSDAIAGEFQDAFDVLSKELVDSLGLST